MFSVSSISKKAADGAGVPVRTQVSSALSAALAAKCIGPSLAGKLQLMNGGRTSGSNNILELRHKIVKYVIATNPHTL
jgi:hypothetical protein